MTKAAYVVAEARKGQAGKHHCHWPGCERIVPPAFWGCRKHWGELPYALRQRIWATYQPGQEVSKTPSREYVEAARAVQEWIANRPVEAGVPATAWETLQRELATKRPAQPRLL